MHVIYYLQIATLAMAPIVVYLGVRKENKIVCGVFLVTSLLVPGFLIYNTVILWLPSTHDIVKEWGGPSISTMEIKIGLTLLSALAFLVRIFLIIMTSTSMVNFNRGLKEAFVRYKNTEAIKLNPSGAYYTSDFNSSASSNQALFAVTSTGEIINQPKLKFFKILLQPINTLIITLNIHTINTTCTILII